MVARAERSARVADVEPILVVVSEFLAETSIVHPFEIGASELLARCSSSSAQLPLQSCVGLAGRLCDSRTARSGAEAPLSNEIAKIGWGLKRPLD